jgi:hypothetical protein
MPWDIDRSYSDSAKDKDWLPKRPRRTRKQQVKIATAGIIAGALGVGGLGIVTATVKHRNDALAAVNAAQPGCDMTAGSFGDSVSVLRAKFHGDSNLGEVSIMGADGHKKNRENDPTINGELIVNRGDTVRFAHVDPMVCEWAGGAVLGAEAREPIPLPGPDPAMGTAARPE